MVLTVHGGTGANSIVCYTLCEPGDNVVCLLPNYQQYYAIPEAIGAADVLHISPSHHFPTGLITPMGRRQPLLRWANEGEKWIIEDDYDSEFRFSGRPIPTLQSIDRIGCVVYMNTFSQTISPSMRVGFMVLPPRLLERYHQELNFYSCTVPTFMQFVLTELINNGDFERHINRVRRNKRKELTQQK